MAPKQQTYAEGMVERGVSHPERRAELVESLLSSCVRLCGIVEDLRENLTLMLEAQPEIADQKIPAYRRQPLAPGHRGIRAGACTGHHVLAARGPTPVRRGASRRPRRHLERMHEVDEEALADSLSAYLEGTATRQDLEEVRRKLADQRARLDEAVIDTLAAMDDE